MDSSCPRRTVFAKFNSGRVFARAEIRLDREPDCMDRPKKPGLLCFTACIFRNIDKICIKFGINQSHFILNIILNLFESTLENKVTPSSE